MITTDKEIRIYDDTGRGDSFEVVKVYYENKKLIVCNVANETYDGEITVLIFKKDRVVVAKELNFYLAENIG